MMRMMVNKMEAHDNNQYNNKENDGTNNDTNNGNQEGKRHANSSMRTKTTAEMQIHDQNKMATTTDQ